MGDIVPRNELVKRGMKGLGGVGGGIGLLVLNSIAGGAGISVPGLVIGGAVTLVGLAISSSKDDRTAGLVTTVAGGLTVLASLPLIGGLAGGLMWLAGVGLIIAGGVSLYKFLRGMKNNS